MTAESKRLNVALDEQTAKLLHEVIAAEGVALTEAARCLIGYGGIVWRATKDEDSSVLLRKGEDLREIVIL